MYTIKAEDLYQSIFIVTNLNSNQLTVRLWSLISFSVTHGSIITISYKLMSESTLLSDTLANVK